MSAAKLTRCRALWAAHLRANRGALFLAALGSIGYAVAELAAPWPLKLILDYVLLRKPVPESLPWLKRGIATNPEWTIVLIASCILVAAAAKGAFAYLQLFITSRIGYELVHALRRKLFNHLQRMSLAQHSRARAGELLTKVTSDTNVLKDVFAGGVLEVAGHCLLLVSTFAVLVTLNWRLAGAAAATVPLLAIAMFTIYRRGKTSARRQREREGEVAAHIAEVLHLTPLVRAFARESIEEERFDRQSSATLAQSIKTARVEAAAGRTVELLNALGVFTAVTFGGLFALRGSITPGDLLVFTSYLTGMYKPLRNLAKLSTQFSKAMASAERIEDILSAEVEAPGEGIPPGELAGQLEFRNVDFAYSPGQPVLHDVSFTILAGEHVALVGASGGGKSTIASLLLRFYKPQAGAIFADGQDISQFDPEQYRRQIGVVLQDTLLFGSTIAENIAYGKPDATRVDIEDAARRAAAHDFIARLPQGYDTVLNERATTLSGGQRQRLSLARALLKQPAVLILDEPTASVDSESASRIHETIAQHRRGKTTLVIAHQFHSMERFDWILVLSGGRLAEQGTHRELIDRRGLYWGLLRSQPTAEGALR